MDRINSIFPTRSAADGDVAPSSSPAFGTPVHPVRSSTSTRKPNNNNNLLPGKKTSASVLPIILPPATLRPIAFRTFTRKHNLTISSNTLQLLATFIGKHCGSKWREEGLAEKVLDEVAKMWRKNGGAVIVEEGNGASIKAILQTLEGSMVGGRIVGPGKTASAERDQNPLLRGQDVAMDGGIVAGHADSQQDDNAEETEQASDPRRWLKVISAFEQPRLTYNATKKHFEVISTPPSLFPDPSHQHGMWKDRYNLVYQRILRNESFQGSTLSVSLSDRPTFKLTQITNLLGRSGSSHLLLGLLSISPAGELSLTDPTGSIVLDLTHARAVPENGAWFTPGMVVLVEGIYEEEEVVRGSTLGGNSGVGGAIGGRFIGISIAGPPCERREVTLGLSAGRGSSDDNNVIGSNSGFGWVDFLGVGSERSQGARMRRLEARCRAASSRQRTTMVIASEVHLDQMVTLEALRSMLATYADLPADELPMAIILLGNFASVPALTLGQGGRATSVEYKEYFDTLAAVLADYPTLLRHTTFIFVPGDHDPWGSAFAAGAATVIPREPVPALFTSRVKRVFASAQGDADAGVIWTTNPARVSLFGPVHELVVFRDDMTGRFRRSSVHPGTALNSEEATEPTADADAVPDDQLQQQQAQLQTTTTTSESHTQTTARKLVKTVLDQSHLSPFPLSTRPVLWDHASALSLYPLPTALVLADAEAPPFAITYEGCHVMNPGRLVPVGRKGVSRWVEFDVLRNRGRVKEGKY